jgi:hypothetical protein
MPAARLLAFRALLSLLLATIGLQAVPAHSVGVERHRGSAFDISAFEVATAAVLRSADQHEVRLAEPDPDPVPPLLVPIAVPVVRGDAAPLPAPSQACRTPSPRQDTACLAGAPRAPPIA